MFSDLSKLFSYGFVVGFFLPAMLLITATRLLVLLFEPKIATSLVDIWGQLEIVWTLPGALVVAWLLGTLLLIINRALIRFLEGYGLLKRIGLLNRQLQRFDTLKKRLDEVKEKRDTEKREYGEARPETIREYRELFWEWRRVFPHERSFILPTRFGNTLRAFEVYPYVLYGIDSIALWPRMLALLPTDFRNSINEAKARVDFGVNMVYLTPLVILEYGILAIITTKLPMPWLVFLLLVVTWLSYRLTISSALQWGDLVKSVFDLYRGDLLKQMGLKQPESWDEERKLWLALSRSFHYWEPLQVPRDSRNKDEDDSERQSFLGKKLLNSITRPFRRG
jgi:hypothetical protein